MSLESRRYTVLDARAQMGRSTRTLVCPFCAAEVVAYLWSLAGSGKRCDCGAKFDYDGNCTREVT